MEMEWIPYLMRRSESELTYEDDGEGRVVVHIAVAGLGEIVLSAEASFSLVSDSHRWDRFAVLRASLVVASAVQDDASHETHDWPPDVS
jgi:hypothetical protein